MTSMNPYGWTFNSEKEFADWLRSRPDSNGYTVRVDIGAFEMFCASDRLQMLATGCGIRIVGPNNEFHKPAVSALDTQVAGDHYRKMKIQPVEFIHANNIPFLEGCIIKRICRWKNKDGIQDLEKIKHEVDLLIELHKKSQSPGSAAPDAD